MLKRCPKCEEWKDEGEYHKRGKNGGLQSYCKVCGKKAVATYAKTSKGAERRREYQKTDERRATNREWQARYRKTEGGKEVNRRINTSDKGKERYARHRSTDGYTLRHRQDSAKYKSSHPEKIKAHQAVAIAIRKGAIPHPGTLFCNKCSEKAKHYHHHKGYAKENWLDVEPLCPTCHANIHLRQNIP